ncbi:MAG: hypothetical protein ACM3Y9_08325 [Ignavibacteria bacterium]
MALVPSRDSRIAKKLLPGAPGTKKLVERFGARLVCVRYRIDQQAQRRFTTVELVVADAPMAKREGGDVFVRVAYEEEDLRKQVKAAGGEWHPTRKLWRLPKTKARALGLLTRIEAAALYD